MNTKEILNLPGQKKLQIGEGVVYTIINRYDPSAPDGLKNLNTTKLPNDSGVDHLSVAYRGNIGRGIYDTGIYADSPILSNIKKEEAEELEKRLKELVVTPIERKYGQGALDHVGENEFWDRYIHTIKVGNRYHMDKPEDILALYLAVIYGRVAEKDDNSSLSRNASFSYVNVNQEMTVESERRTDRFNSNYEYMKLREAKGNKLRFVFEYLDLPIMYAGKNINTDATDNVFDRMSNGSDSYEFNKKFIKVAKSAFTKKGFDKLEGHSKITHLVKAGIITKGNDNIYQIEDVKLGLSIEDSSEMYVDTKNNQGVKEIIDAAIEKTNYK